MEQAITKGKIGFEIEMDNITPDEVAALKDCFVKLTELQMHRFRNGKMILHFDNSGLQKIQLDQYVWKRGKKV